MFIFRQLVEALLNPLFLIWICFAVLLILLYRKKIHQEFFTAFAVVFILLTVISTGFLPHKLTDWLESKYHVVTSPDPDIHWVVVLGGGQVDYEGMPANMILGGTSIVRLTEGVRLYRNLPKARLLLSGGSYYGYVTEAEHMAMVAYWFGIPRQDVVLENKGINTAGEARELKKILGEQPFYLVTSGIHMYRSMLLCQAQGLHPVPAPVDFTHYWRDERWKKNYLPNPFNMVYLSIVMHEMLGIVWGRVTGDMEKL